MLADVRANIEATIVWIEKQKAENGLSEADADAVVLNRKIDNGFNPEPGQATTAAAAAQVSNGPQRMKRLKGFSEHASRTQTPQINSRVGIPIHNGVVPTGFGTAKGPDGKLYSFSTSGLWKPNGRIAASGLVVSN